VELEVKGVDVFAGGRRLATAAEVHMLWDRMQQIYKGVEAMQAAISGTSPLAPIGYSSQEQAVPGVTWIDGSQVYQITLSGITGAVLNNYNDTGLRIDGMGAMVSLSGRINNSAGSWIPANHLTHIGFTVDANGALHEYHDSANYSARPFAVTVLYTRSGV